MVAPKLVHCYSTKFREFLNKQENGHVTSGLTQGHGSRNCPIFIRVLFTDPPLPQEGAT